MIPYCCFKLGDSEHSFPQERVRVGVLSSSRQEVGDGVVEGEVEDGGGELQLHLEERQLVLDALR